MSDGGDFQRYGVGLFEGCTDAQLRRLGTIVERVPYADGDVICRQGELAKDFHVVLDGLVELSVGATITQRVGPGEFFGEVAMLAGRARHATAVAIGNVLVGTFSAEAFEDILVDMPVMSRKLLHRMAERIWFGLETGVLRVARPVEAGQPVD